MTVNSNSRQIAVVGTRFGEPTIERAGLTEFSAEFMLTPGHSGDEIIADCANAWAIMAGGAPKFPRDVLSQLPHLQVIIRYGVGVDTVDLDAATELGIIVANVPDYATEEVSTHTVALILAAVRKLRVANQAVRSGDWKIAVVRPLFSMADQTIGVVGFGKIGQAVIRKLRPFNSRILVSDPFAAAVDVAAAGGTLVSFDELVDQVDVLSLNAPLTEATYHLINAEVMARMKETAIIVNTSRGGLIDEMALAEALNQGQLGGAALDVLEKEPGTADNPLIQSENSLVTPHMAWYSVQATARMREFATVELVRILEGQRPRNFVNPAVQGGSRWNIN